MKVSQRMTKIMGFSPVSNGFSLFLWDFSLHVCLKLQYGCGEKRKERGCCLHPFARKELTEHTAEQVGQDC